MEELFYGKWTVGSLQAVAPIANVIMTGINWTVSLAGLFGVGFGVIRFVADMVCIMAPNFVMSVRQARTEVANTVKAVGDQSTIKQVGGIVQGIISHFPDFYSISSFHGKDGQPDQIPGLGQYFTKTWPMIACTVTICVLIYGGYTTKIYGMIGNAAKYGLDFMLENTNPEQIVASLANGAGNYVIGTNMDDVRVGTEKAISAIFTRFSDIPAVDRQSVTSWVEQQLGANSSITSHGYEQGKYKSSATAYVTKVPLSSDVVSNYNSQSLAKKNSGSYQVMTVLDLNQGVAGLKNSITLTSDEWNKSAYLVVTITYTKTAGLWYDSADSSGDSSNGSNAQALPFANGNNPFASIQ